MNKDKVKGHTSDTKDDKEVAGKMTDNQRTENKNKAEKQSGKNGTVLGEVNGDARGSSK